MPKEGELVQCVVCRHKDRGVIETLMARGAFVTDLADTYGLTKVSLLRHDAIHSTRIPTVDPESILRQMRWLNEQTYFLVNVMMVEPAQKDPETGKNIRLKRAYHFEKRAAAITLSLKVLSELATLTNAKKHMDPYIVQPRWENIMKRLAHRLRDEPAALKKLQNWMDEEGPAESQEDVQRRADNLDADKKGAIPGVSTEITGWDPTFADDTPAETKVKILRMRAENIELEEKARKQNEKFQAEGQVILDPKLTTEETQPVNDTDG